ncbi:ribonuclease P protein subunit p14 [Vespa crabro]|uniref:ribonuclease P protein subunit p14 n=1 Tax=Vespa crabro TaxID=7445 RepID=UPI001F02759F|nr:ribonuclease P protein subunit p14 [Vespa crabro]
MYYLDVSLEFADSPNIKISHIYLKKNILHAVKQLFGEEGTKSVIDILKYDIPERRFVLRCDSDFYIKLRASLTVAGQFEGKPCVYIVHRASANLLSFVGDSRNYKHE